MHSQFGALAFGLAFSAAVGAATAARADINITINKANQRMSVSVDGQPTYLWPVSTGKAGYRTPNGSYTANRMEEVYFSKQWDDAPMPHSIFFTLQGHAIHGTYDTAHLGTAVSHGCVRISPENATTLFAMVKAEGLGHTHVRVVGDDVSDRPRNPTPSPAPRDYGPQYLPSPAPYPGPYPYYSPYPPPARGWWY